jgi:UDP-N-acetylglucosamine diphosphorylase / glucose-1-phosphate thymidylyltransferase / UDP-N-acetylgalactosamine diphosphorylase / glucosamine-1-phosphate N-acetyltransferase / galactosamine-1-phosphate N-acetyltransferase
LAAHSLLHLMIVLIDTEESSKQFYPLSLTRPLGEMRRGMTSFRQYWELVSGEKVCCLSHPAISKPLPQSGKYTCVDARLLADEACLKAIMQLAPGMALRDPTGVYAWCQQEMPIYGKWEETAFEIQYHAPQPRVSHLYQIILANSHWMQETYTYLTKNRQSAIPASSNTIIGSNLFVEDGVVMEACTINTTEGPVYIAKNALIMEGTCMRGPVYIGENAVVKMGAQLYAGTNIGKGCTAGGEIKNAILQAFSNKAHHGYLGDSYVGAWCNLGAGTTNSNVKNTAASIRVWDQTNQSWQNAGSKLGLIMGDFSKTAINTSFNSGTTVGICCSIHGFSMPPKHIPSFSWGPNERYQLPLALDHIANWKSLKGQGLFAEEIELLTDVWNHLSD